MRDTMQHRGPDDAGLYVSPQQEVGLGHRRLSIIDLSSAAVQPMSNDEESVWIVFNGEIYNHAEIRPELEKLGRKFKTNHSDTEVILKGYEQWGEGVLSRLRGMFAFAIWDKKEGKIWLARDRMGVKPLYYTFHNGMFLFASEIKALLAYPGVKRAMHERSFYDFLTFLVAPAPQTLFEGIFKLPASHTLTVFANGRTKTRRYWNPFHELNEFPKHSEREYIDRIMHTLRESIRYRMVSDVNFGVFLSGGIDSSTNTALMAEQMARPVETFSIGYENGGAFNELSYARQIVERYKTNHHEIIIKPKDLVDFLPKLVFHQDEPIVDPVCVPVYYVSKLAKDNGTTVCQVGEGADELFCGYPLWGMCLRAQPWVDAYQKIPSSLRRIAWDIADTATRSPKAMRRLDVFRRASAGESIFWGGAEAYQETTKQRFLSGDFLGRLKGHTSYSAVQSLRDDFENDAPDGADMLHWMSYLDLRLRLPELLLMRVDKMTMATAVEARVPFLDQEFVQLAMSIPQSLKYKNKTLKYLLKRAVEPVLPREVIYRRKQGFGVPVETWFQKELKSWSSGKIMDFTRRTDYFDEGVMRTYLQTAGSKMSWFLLNFVLWHETWIEQKEILLPL
jgi:asparagine synthase (glutamine-hydrolysing)